MSAAPARPIRPGTAAAVACAVVATLMVTPAAAQNAERGRQLFELGCRGCHGGSVFSRPGRIARDVAGIRQQVRRWRDNAGLPWSEAEIDDVTAFLNRAHYKFAQPPR